VDLVILLRTVHVPGSVGVALAERQLAGDARARRGDAEQSVLSALASEQAAGAATFRSSAFNVGDRSVRRLFKPDGAAGREEDPPLEILGR
jgi:hypothetical protein